MKVNSWGVVPSALTTQIGTPQGPGKAQGEQGSDGGHSPGGHQGEGQPRKRNPYASAAPAAGSAEVSLAELERAVASFEKESAAGQTQGLHAVIETLADPPGLRVILRDHDGQVLRRLSPGEFVKLRGLSSGDARMPGKVLDQKL